MAYISRKQSFKNLEIGRLCMVPSHVGSDLLLTGNSLSCLILLVTDPLGKGE
jgi:hypothetical protein